MSAPKYDVVAVGTGFATSFFLHRFLSGNRSDLRVLVLEAGRYIPHAEQLKKGDWRWMRADTEERFVNHTPEKQWNFYSAFGGASNCWAACTPRLLPEDFRLRSTYGIGEDWPIGYDDLEPFYCDAEELMQISGDSDDTPCPRSRPYPQPAHGFTAPDRLLKAAFPRHVFSHPCARSPRAVPNQRPACCNNGVCLLCPMDAKFTILNGMRSLYEDPRVEVIHGARVQAIEHTQGAATGFRYLRGDRAFIVRCDLAVLGANAMFNPHILLRSGLDDNEVGRGLCEQVSRTALVELDGVNNFKGSTISTALSYMCHSGPDRRRKAAALIQHDNRSGLLNQRGRWLQTFRMNFMFEELRLPENRVTISRDDPTKPAVHYKRSEHTNRGLEEMKDELPRVLAPLPVKNYEIGEPWGTDSHIIGTTVMGDDPERSVVDRNGIHHRLRNLVVVGSSLFPSAAPANPTLTLGALALRSAHLLRG